MDGLTHVLGAGGTIQADHVDGHALQDREGGSHVGAKQHPPGGIQGYLRLDWQADAGLIKGFLDAGDGSLDFEDILGCLDQQQVNATLDETDGLFAKNVGKLSEADGGEVGIVGGREPAGRTGWEREPSFSTRSFK